MKTLRLGTGWKENEIIDGWKLVEQIRVGYEDYHARIRDDSVVWKIEETTEPNTVDNYRVQRFLPHADCNHYEMI